MSSWIQVLLFPRWDGRSFLGWHGRAREMRMRWLAVLALGGVMVAGCASSAASPRAAVSPAVPSGWVRHVLDGVSFAAPPYWKVGPDPVCAPVPTDTIGVLTSNEQNLPAGAAIAIGLTSCASMNAIPTPTSAWVSIDCVIAPRVALPNDKVFVSTAGAIKVLQRGSDPFYFAGQGEVVEVSAGPDPVAQQILRTVTPRRHRC